MAFGLPVVATDVGEIPIVVRLAMRFLSA
jgi:hypothetical protein